MLTQANIVELTKKYLFERYSFLRLTNNVSNYIGTYLAAFYLNTFRQIERKNQDI